MMKKIAVLIYPYFSMQEISCLTDALSVYYHQNIDIFASSSNIIKTEDNFQIIANKTLDEFHVADYACLILPGTLNPLPALFDERIITFLKQLHGQDILIASISSSPMLLAKAGLLDNTYFTSGIWKEISDYFDFIPSQNIVSQPLVKDRNIITAIGFAFREFAVEVIKTLGIDDCKDGLFNGIVENNCEKNYTYFMGEDNFQEYLIEYNDYVQKMRNDGR